MPAGLLSRWFGGGGAGDGVGSEKDGAAAAFCSRELPEMMRSFVDHVVDCAYTGAPPAAPADEAAPPPLPLRLPAAERLVAIGDLHGDLPKARRAFKLAGLTDDAGNWVGGSTVCVQVGDILDRGDQELGILYWLEALQAQAAAAGGALHVLNGNHETMNVAGNYRYATAGADTEMASWASWQLLGDRLRRRCGCDSVFGDDSHAAAAASGIAAVQAHDATAAVAGGSGRAAQFNPLRRATLRPGGPVSQRFFARHPTVLQVGSTLFVHGGVLPAHVEYGLDKINAETQAWLMGEGPPPSSGSGGGSKSNNSAAPASPRLGWLSGAGAAAAAVGSGTQGGSKPAARHSSSSQPTSQQQQQQQQQPPPPPPAPSFLRGGSAIVWARDYSARDEARCDCEKLTTVLEALPGAKRMVMGHTIQEGGVTSACGGRALRIDVGMSRGCGDGEPEVLEILQDGAAVRRLAEGAAPEPIGAGAVPGAPHAPHHLTGPAVDTPSGGAAAAWAEAVARLRESLFGGSGGGAGGASAAAGAAPKHSAESEPRRQPTPT